ncbi:MAG TPA: hypothetical protein VEW46_03310 [Pyrinomonadaceae bacterium]|nr:hypothetical protein [Pyrinomonadaceae bacterium]
MSSGTFDPNKFRVEDLFRAKEERRKQLASLPFQEKIKIVERLKTVPAAFKNERLIFDSFLNVCPDFAGELIQEWDVVEEWYAKRAIDPPLQPFDKRPDIIAVTASGRRIGVELKSWVNREQIADARKQERIQENILKAIGKQPPNKTQHIGQVWLSPKQLRFDAGDDLHFREQLFVFVEKVDKDCSQSPEREQNLLQDQDRNDFAAFPILEKYLDRVRFHSKVRHRSNNWITFPYSASFFSSKTMLDTLKRALLTHRDDEKYKDLRKHVGLDEVYLLVHYDFKAFAYNTPFDAPNFGFKEAAKFASNALQGDGGHFDRIFLFHFLCGKEKAYRVI